MKRHNLTLPATVAVVGLLAFLIWFITVRLADELTLALRLVIWAGGIALGLEVIP